MATSYTARRGLAGETQWSQISYHRNIAELDSPYGTLIKSVELPQGDGVDPVHWLYICPLAFLWHQCQASSNFFQMLQSWPDDRTKAQPTKQARIAMYLDDVMPGNQHRPDMGRSYVAIYWALIDLPDWMLHSTNGWFVLAFVPKRIWTEIPGEQSGLMVRLLKAFYPDEGLSFAETIMLQHGSECLALTAQEINLWLLDGDAVPKVTQAKTMSAFKCCSKCSNVVARVAPHKIPAGTPVFLGTISKPTFQKLLVFLGGLSSSQSILFFSSRVPS